MPMARQPHPATVVGAGVDVSTAVGEGVSSPSPTTVGEGVVVGAGACSSIVGAIVFRAAGAGVVSVAVGAIVFSAVEAGVDAAAVGAVVARSAGADVNGGTVAVGSIVPKAAAADVDSEAVVPRAIGAAVAPPVDVGAAEKKEGEGDAPMPTGRGYITPVKNVNFWCTEHQTTGRWKRRRWTLLPFSQSLWGGIIHCNTTLFRIHIRVTKAW